MTAKAFIWDLLGYRWVAVWSADAPIALYLDLPHAPSQLGDVWVGRVARVAPALDAAFVDLGEAGTGFLRGADAGSHGRRRPIGERVHEGQWLSVEIVRDAAPSDDKGPGLSTRLSAGIPDNLRQSAWHGPHKPRRLAKRSGALSRLIREWDGDRTDFVEAGSPSVAADLRDALGGERMIVKDAIARDAVCDAIDQALNPVWRAPGGESVRFDHVQTMTAIDVDGTAAPEAINFRAAGEIPRLLRLKRVGGVCIVDFVTMGDRAARKRVAETLREAAHGDPAIGEIGPLSARGLLELTRRKTGPSIPELMTTPCSVCGGSSLSLHPAVIGLQALDRLKTEAIVSPGRRPFLRVAPTVADSIDRWLRPALARHRELVGNDPRIETVDDASPDAPTIDWSV